MRLSDWPVIGSTLLLLATGAHAQTASQLAPPRIIPPVINYGSAVTVPQSTVSPALPHISGAQGSASLKQSTVFERRRIDASAFGVAARLTLPAGLTASAEYGRASTDVLAGSTDRLTFSIIAQF
jgi:hypothetical protein